MKKPPCWGAGRLGGLLEWVLGDFGGVEGLPVVEVVEVDGVGGFAVGEADGGEDVFADFVFVLVAGDGCVDGCDAGFVEVGGVGGDEFLEFDIGWFFLRDEGDEGVRGDADGIEDHVVVARGAVGVSVGEFAGSAEAHFLPEAREVKDAEWASGSGGDGRYDFVTHGARG